MAKRKAISKKTRFEVFKRDGFTCQYCGQSAPGVVLHVDHIKPVKEGGTNDIINLITSCVGCNSGKGARELSDDTTITKQKIQLDEMNERRLQLEMIVAWRDGMVNLHEQEVDTACEAFDNIIVGYTINDTGRKKIEKVVKKFGLRYVLVAIDISQKYLSIGKDGLTTLDSLDLAFEKLNGISYNLKTSVDTLRDYGWLITEPNDQDHDDDAERAWLELQDNQQDHKTTDDPADSTPWCEMIAGKAS
jgi:hypothetical protein